MTLLPKFMKLLKVLGYKQIDIVYRLQHLLFISPYIIVRFQRRTCTLYKHAVRLIDKHNNGVAMENHKTWVLIADASKARLYIMHKARMLQQLNHTKNLELIGEFTHSNSRKKNADLVSDRTGEFGSGGFVESSAKVKEAEYFAKELLQHIENGRVDNQFRDLIIVAPPTFIGMINKHMPKEVDKLIFKTIEKDYTQLNEKDLEQSLINHI